MTSHNSKDQSFRTVSDVGVANRAPPKAIEQETVAENRAIRMHYSLIVRIPFSRAGFEDPPQVHWTAENDRTLWKIIASTSAMGNLDWVSVAMSFDVPVPFILQQAAWLYQRHMESMREQMRRVGVAANSTSTTNITAPAGGIAMKRLGSGGQARTQSSQSIRPVKDVTILKTSEQSAPTLPRPAGPSRTPSATTVTQSNLTSRRPSSPRQHTQSGLRPSSKSAFLMEGRQGDPIRSAAMEGDSQHLISRPRRSASPLRSSPSSSTSSSNSSFADPRSNMAPSRIMQRPAHRPFGRRKPSHTTLDNDGERDSTSSEEPLLACQHTNVTKMGLKTESSAEPTRISSIEVGTLSDASKRSEASSASSPARRNGLRGKFRVDRPLSSSASSSSSANPSLATHKQEQPDDREGYPGFRGQPMNVRGSSAVNTAGRRVLGKKAPLGDGTPSMGSSFSDLDDTSVTKSALEEALASNFRHGTASRISNLSNALKSRYLN